MKSVELNMAFQWDCPECSKSNFTHAGVVDNYATNEMELASPPNVKCSQCGEAFTADCPFELNTDDED